MTDLDSSVAGVATLAEPVRRRLYDFVISQPAPVSREQAAEAVGVASHTAKFHLDKLADEGLLSTEYRRLSGRRGPGAGRPTKLYQRSLREVSVSLPPRRYDLAGGLLARAIEASVREGEPVLTVLHREAARLGRTMAEEIGAPGSGGVDAVHEMLAAHGFEPRVDGDTITLGNCPFHALAREHTQLVCGMNLALLTAVADGIESAGLVARLEPGPDRCCVVLGPAPAPGGGREVEQPH